MFYTKGTYFTLEWYQGQIQARSVHNNVHSFHYLIILEDTESFILLSFFISISQIRFSSLKLWDSIFTFANVKWVAQKMNRIHILGGCLPLHFPAILTSSFPLKASRQRWALLFTAKLPQKSLDRRGSKPSSSSSLRMKWFWQEHVRKATGLDGSLTWKPRTLRNLFSALSLSPLFLSCRGG